MFSSATARLRVICILASCAAPSLVGCAFEGDSADDETVEDTAQALTSDVAVYTNGGPSSPWQNWSWSATTAVANTDAPLASGSSSHLKATVTSGWGALALARSTGDLAVSDFQEITFDVRGTSSSSIRLAIEPLGGGGSGPQVSVPVTTTWTRQTVKLDALRGSLTKLGKIEWISPQSGQTFYVDNVKVVAKATTTATTTSSSTFPTSPLTVTKNDVVTLNSSQSQYFLYVPNSYDASHKTPTKLLVWLHGCGGNGYGDAWATSPGGSQSWITISIGGRDGACWNSSTDSPLPLAAIDDVKRRLNIDPRRVFIGGYSSGGNMAYRTAFYNAKRFAGVLAENTAPFYGTNSSSSASIAAAAWKLNIAHLAHTSDTTYAISLVRSEAAALENAGFPTTRIERPGTHWDADTSNSGTNYDMRTLLLPYIDAGWVAPL